jgi:hypothetical protein
MRCADAVQPRESMGSEKGRRCLQEWETARNPRVTILLFDGLSCVEENEAEPASTTTFPGQPDQPREVPSLRQRGALRWVESASCDGELAHFLPHEARTIPLSADL